MLYCVASFWNSFILRFRQIKKIAPRVALIIYFGIHSFDETLLPRVLTASQQAHEKLKIDSVTFYTHKFPLVTSLGLRKAQKKKRKLVGGTSQDVQTSITISPIKTAVRVRVQVTKIWKRDNKYLEHVKVEIWSPPTSRRSSEASRSLMERLVNFKTGSAQRERCFSWNNLEYLKFWMVKKGRKTFKHRYPIGAP